MAERDPGVPGALAEAIGRLSARVAPELMDRLWIFPPLRKGRRESGLVAAGCFADEGRRLLVTLAYRAQETGKGIAFEPSFQEEGEAPKDRLARVIEGVVQRSGEEFGEPRSVRLEGDPGALATLLGELPPFPPQSHPGAAVRAPGSAEEASS
jgi:hypothetical protein